MTAEVKKVICDMEKEHDISVLYACESGSRAWGFASPDSDYDIRFVYAHPKNWYLQLEGKRDYIDTFLPGDLDLSGWDLAKTLRLFSTCNLALNEWLDSPVIYHEMDGFNVELKSLIPAFFNPRKALHHYLSMAKSVYEKHYDDGRIGIKKLFYVTRPLFCCGWIEKYLSMPPTAFQDVLDAELVSDEIVSLILGIRTQKETAVEGFVIEIPLELQQWIDDQLIHFERISETLPGSPEKNWEPLNQLFLDRAF